MIMQISINVIEYLYNIGIHNIYTHNLQMANYLITELNTYYLTLDPKSNIKIS